MHLDTYVDDLRHHLAIAAEAGGQEAVELAGRLTAPLESATRLVLLAALSAAADEITRELAPGAVEVRLRGTDPESVVAPPAAEAAFAVQPAVPAGNAVGPEPAVDDGNTARLNLRLPESLKQRIEDAAGAEGISLNAWLVRAATAALGQNPQRRHLKGGERYSGWVR